MRGPQLWWCRGRSCRWVGNHDVIGQMCRLPGMQGACPRSVQDGGKFLNDVGAVVEVDGAGFDAAVLAGRFRLP